MKALKHQFRTTTQIITGLALSLLIALPSQAVPITDLYNTGVDNNGNPLGASVDDPHYVLTSSPGNYTDVTVPNGYPIGPWRANDSNSRWIGINTTQSAGPSGWYTFQTSFTLSALADLNTVSITGRWTVDDTGHGPYINGLHTGHNTSWNSWRTLNITSGFQTGVNVLEFRVHNSGGPIGLRVDDLVGTYELIAVPGPAGVFLLAIGLLGLAARKSQSNRLI